MLKIAGRRCKRTVGIGINKERGCLRNIAVHHDFSSIMKILSNISSLK